MDKLKMKMQEDHENVRCRGCRECAIIRRNLRRKARLKLKRDLRNNLE